MECEIFVYFKQTFSSLIFKHWHSQQHNISISFPLWDQPVSHWLPIDTAEINVDVSTIEFYAHLGYDAAFLDNQRTYYPGILISNWLSRNIHPQVSHWEKFRVGVCSSLSGQIHRHVLISKYNIIYVPNVNKSDWNLCVQFLFTCLCFTDLIIAGY